MAWVIAKLRGQRVYARADASGQLLAEAGRVEIRYKPKDGRFYRAAARNLTVVDGTALPDDTCAPAEDPKLGGKKKVRGSRRGAQKRTSRRGGGGACTDHVAVAAAARVVAYTDGACSGNPGPAGLGVVFLNETERIECFEYLGEGTNNIAELTAILRALEELGEQPGPVVIFTDSRYSIGVLQQDWKAKKNKQLIATTRARLGKRSDVTLHYVKGHAGIPLNEKADELARLAVETRNSGRSVLPSDSNQA